jgi:hypothetical protein
MKPFNTNTTREERQEWFAQTPPWDQVPSSVVDTILDGITDKVMLDAFVLTSMEQNLVPRYEALGRQSTPDIIRAQISHILCLAGNQAIALLAKALDMNDTENARKAYQLAMSAFEPAIALAKNQVVAYAGIPAAYGMVSKRSESQNMPNGDWLSWRKCVGPLRTISIEFFHPRPWIKWSSICEACLLGEAIGHSGSNAYHVRNAGQDKSKVKGNEQHDVV